MKKQFSIICQITNLITCPDNVIDSSDQFNQTNKFVTDTINKE